MGGSQQRFPPRLISQCESRWLMRIYTLLYDQHRRYRIAARVDRGDQDIHGEHVAMMEAALARISMACSRHTRLISGTPCARWSGGFFERSA